MLKLERVVMELGNGGRPLRILHAISLEVPRGQFLAVVGPSGSGKSTLLGLMAGLDTPTSGAVFLDGTDITGLDEDALTRLRRGRVGIVFQSYHLIPSMTALENVSLPLELAGDAAAAAKAADWLAAVDLQDRAGHYPVQLSGGEQQRVAIARAFAARPQLLLADEPTGNLDSATGARILELLARLRREQGTTLVMVTHDPALAALADRVITLKDGRIVDAAA